MAQPTPKPPTWIERRLENTPPGFYAFFDGKIHPIQEVNQAPAPQTPTLTHDQEKLLQWMNLTVVNTIPKVHEFINDFYRFYFERDFTPDYHNDAGSRKSNAYLEVIWNGEKVNPQMSGMTIWLAPRPARPGLPANAEKSWFIDSQVLPLQILTLKGTNPDTADLTFRYILQHLTWNVYDCPNIVLALSSCYNVLPEKVFDLQIVDAGYHWRQVKEGDIGNSDSHRTLATVFCERHNRLDLPFKDNDTIALGERISTFSNFQTLIAQRPLMDAVAYRYIWSVSHMYRFWNRYHELITKPSSHISRARRRIVFEQCAERLRTASQHARDNQ